MNVVTASYPFMDIDAYAGCIGYAELLNSQGVEARAVSIAPLNESITPEIRSWEAPLERTYTESIADTFSIVDTSAPSFLERFVDPARVVRILDHHSGFERFWQHLGEAATIEMVGAAATLVYEEWVKADKLAEMSKRSARLLIAAILDNTLNFKSILTTERDRAAYTALSPRADLPAGWSTKYFTDCQASIDADLPTAICNDSKVLPDARLLPRAFGQLVVWDARDIMRYRRPEIVQTMETMSDDWAMNLVSIEEGKSYFMANNPISQQKFGKLVGLDLSLGIVEAGRLWLRKEVLERADYESNAAKLADLSTTVSE